MAVLEDYKTTEDLEVLASKKLTSDHWNQYLEKFLTAYDPTIARTAQFFNTMSLTIKSSILMWCTG